MFNNYWNSFIGAYAKFCGLNVSTNIDQTNHISEHSGNIEVVNTRTTSWINYIDFSMNFILVIIWFFVLIVVLYFLIGLYSASAQKTFLRSIFNIIYYLLGYIEKELMNLSALLKFILFLILFLGSFAFISLLIPTISIFLSFVFYSLLLLVVSVLIIPVYLIYSYGIFYIAYIRGSSLKKNIFFELLVDGLNLTSYFLRINIQFIRIFLVIAMFFLYDEQYYDFVIPLYCINTGYELVTFQDYTCFYLTKVILFVCKWIYELAHFLIICTMQCNVFALIVVMLIQFLYTLYLTNKMESYFSELRGKYNYKPQLAIEAK